ncbi:hypothetical protein ACFXEL_31535 [Streptomyces sp. NPDC059382]|uniref:hypothetical protein n=1 Tax=Streptomyces sp. NPDC059382 TaxID=3346816 RepID=UPI00367B8EA8
MTDDKRAKRAARELAAREGISYTAARRLLAETEDHQEQRDPEPPLTRTAAHVCPEGCDGSGHVGVACWAWRPQDVRGTVAWAIRRSAELPGGRAEQLAERGERPKTQAERWSHFHGWEARWLLALVFAMLADQEPDVLPDRARLRAAVEAGDAAAIEEVMDPLDRAAARLMTKEADRWWREVKPRLDAYAADVAADIRYPNTWHEVEHYAARDRLVERWRTAWEPVRNDNGYMDAPGVMWVAPKGWLDMVLVDRHGGFEPHTRVRLVDGRPAVVYAVEWGEAGPPLAYRVRELVPGNHGNEGRLVPRIGEDGLLAPAADCRPYAPDSTDLIRQP